MIGVTVSFDKDGKTHIGVVKRFDNKGQCLVQYTVSEGIIGLYLVPLRYVTAVNVVA